MGATHRIEHLQNRIAAAIAAIGNQTVPATAQISQRLKVGRDQIGDVDVIANAGAITGWIVGSKDIDMATLSKSCLIGDLDEMGGARGLTDQYDREDPRRRR